MQEKPSSELHRFVEFYPRVILLGVLLGIFSWQIESIPDQPSSPKYLTSDIIRIVKHTPNKVFPLSSYDLERPSFFRSKANLPTALSSKPIYKIKAPLNWPFLNGRMHWGTMYLNNTCLK